MATSPPSLNHFVIFNPTIKPPPTPHPASDERDRDLEDDLAQAAQILFYTSREAGGVSRDEMLRQVGLVKGLGAFSEMVAPGEDPGFWSVHSHKSRMIVFTPEEDFHIYANIALSRSVVEGREKAEPVVSAQGISDNMLVDAIRRGYEDFRLLHGPLSNLLPPSPASSTIIDRFWTRFALTFESTILTPHPDPSGLEVWLGGFPISTSEEAANRAIELFKEDAEIEPESVGAISKDGPISTPPTDPALTRYLVGLLRDSLPREMVHRIIPKEVEQQDRKSSWTGWVPSIGLAPKSSTSKDAPQKKSRWPGLGLGGLGETIGIGGVFSLGGSKTEKSSANGRPVSVAEDRDTTATLVDYSDSGTVHSHEVVQSDVVLPDLKAAQVEPELELKWGSRDIWIGHEVEERCLKWIIRDNILLYTQSRVPSPDPPTTTTLSLFSRLSALATPTDKAALANSAIHTDGSSLSISGPLVDPASALVLRELKDVFETDPSISEVYTRTPASRFVAAKRSGKEELYMLVGRKDASLVDADHAVQAYERARE